MARKAERLAAIDCETYMGIDAERYGAIEGEAFLWGLAWRGDDGRLRYRVRRRFVDVIRLAAREAKATKLLGANSIGFDLTVAADHELADQDYVRVVRQAMSGSSPVLGSLELAESRHNRKGIPTRLPVWDLLQMIPGGSLDALATSYRVRHRKLGDTLAGYDTHYEAFRDRPVDYVRYNRNDVFATLEIAEAFQEQLGVLVPEARHEKTGRVPLKGTAPSLSMSLLTAVDSLPYVESRAEIQAMGEAAYYGGRVDTLAGACEAHNVWRYDVNSLYPAVMRDDTFPDTGGERMEIAEPGLKDWRKYRDRPGLWTVKFRHRSNATLPTLPVKDADGVRVNYPQAGRGTYVSFELAEAEANGAEIVEVEKAIVWKYSRRLAPNMIERLYRAKADSKAAGDKAAELTSKILMNSAYGKFAERRDGEGLLWAADNPLHHVEDHQDADFLVNGDGEIISGHVASYTETREPHYRDMVTAAFVTAHARRRLLQGARRAVEAGNRLLYCDTDSLHITGPGLPDDLVDSLALGYWDLENAGDPASAVYVGRKSYALRQANDGEIVKCKGLGKRSELGYTDLQAIVTGEAESASGTIRTATKPKSVAKGYRGGGTFYALTRNLRDTADPSIEERIP